MTGIRRNGVLRSLAALGFCLGVVATAPVPARAQNKYDVLARTLAPYGALFHSKTPTKALQAEVTIPEGSTTAAAWLHRPLRLNLQLPDRLRVETLDPGARIVVCRVGQRLWIYPSELADRLIAAAGPPQRPAVLPDFRLPLKDNQLVLLAALFQITDFASVRDAEHEPAWRLQFHPATELTGSMAPPPWDAGLVVRQRDYGVRQITVRAPEWSGRLDVASTRFLPALPPELWVPGPAEASGVREIPADRLDGVLAALPNAPYPP